MSKSERPFISARRSSGACVLVLAEVGAALNEPVSSDFAQV
ncbi:MAG: hypothetical protein ACREEM_33200 [Blastocatellia bacterium]